MAAKIIIILVCLNIIFTEAKCNFFQKWYKSDCDEVVVPAYNPDEYLDVPQIIARHGYPSQTHTIISEDGYLLKIHRIPGKEGAQPVFLQHGLLGSSADWIINGNNSLAFLLADKGYDVWLGNARGNTYSKGHVWLPINSPKFWNFSFHEMATKDLPSVLYYVSNSTQKFGEIIYIGHSMGTTMFFIFSSMLPQDAKNVKVMVALAPVAYMTDVKSPLKYFAPFSKNLEWLSRILGINEFLPRNKILKWISYDCEVLEIDEKICENVIFAICGFDEGEFNLDILPVVLSKEPAGASVKTIIHYAQEIKNNGKFQQFDYGAEGNMIEYGTLTPPRYNISAIRRPVYLMYADNDWLASPIDVKLLNCDLRSGIGMYKVKSETFNHVDFLFGKHAEGLVYRPLLKVIANYTL